MKVVVYVLSVLVATALLAGGSFLLVTVTPGRIGWLLLLGTVSLTVFIYGPLMLGSLGTFWDRRRSEESRRYLAWWYRITLALEVLAAVGIVTYAVLTEAPLWLPALFIGVGAVLTVSAVFLGSWLRKREAANPPEVSPWSPISRRDITRKIWKVAVTFAVTVAIGVAFLALFGREIFENDLSVAVVLVAGIAFIAASMAGILVTLPLLKRMREVVDSDAGLLRKLAKVVLKAKQIDLDEEEQVQAARYAAVASTALPFQLAYFVLLYVGLGIQQVQLLSHPQVRPIIITTLALLLAVLVFLVPLYVRYARRARAYAREHAHLFASGEDVAISSPGGQ